MDSPDILTGVFSVFGPTFFANSFAISRRVESHMVVACADEFTLCFSRHRDIQILGKRSQLQTGIGALYMPVIFVSIGFVFMVIGMVLMTIQFKLHKKCTVKTQGIVLDMKKIRGESMYSHLTDQRPYHTETTYAPVFKYTDNGREIIAKSRISGSGALKKGQIVTVFFNPDKAEEYYVPEDKTSKYAGLVFHFVGIFFSAVGVAFVFN